MIDIEDNKKVTRQLVDYVRSKWPGDTITFDQIEKCLGLTIKDRKFRFYIQSAQRTLKRFSIELVSIRSVGYKIRLPENEVVLTIRVPLDIYKDIRNRGSMLVQIKEDKLLVRSL